jgi:hypothetical protein
LVEVGELCFPRRDEGRHCLAYSLRHVGQTYLSVYERCKRELFVADTQGAWLSHARQECLSYFRLQQSRALAQVGRRDV